MKFLLRTWAMLALPGVLVLLGGLPALLRTGQVDPRGWMLPALLLTPAAAFLKARRGEGAAWWVGLGTPGAVLSCAFLASWHVPGLVPVAWLLGVVALATLAGLQFERFRAPAVAGARQLVGLGLALLALAICWLAREPRVEPLQRRPELAVISGLPLFWRDGEKGLAAKADAPIIALLRQRFTVTPVDSPFALEKSRTKALLLAQPRAFSMDELVALNAWIRRGGKALILADPQLRWPMDLPLGDRRRPPAVTPLSAMIEYWGVKLMPPAAGAGEERRFLGDGRMLTVYAASGFDDAGPDCRIGGRGLVAHCGVGKGVATIVADADLIDDRLWLADPAAPLDPGQWTADTPQFVAQALGGELPAGRRWVRSGQALVNAVRWAALAGIFWAALGAVLFRRRNRAHFDRSRQHVIVPKPEIGD
ncbi:MULTISPECIES: Gldg family protein [unclassified Sphingobium]|uniref:Gldg family protein n=1 Tax=unclassified Sphingobium TaxID=2611147 RepID=UPI001F11EF51|nr:MULTISPECIES: Gldg family protein [unclassified Sphingobium]